MDLNTLPASSPIQKLKDGAFYLAKFNGVRNREDTGWHNNLEPDKIPRPYFAMKVQGAWAIRRSDYVDASGNVRSHWHALPAGFDILGEMDKEQVVKYLTEALTKKGEDQDRVEWERLKLKYGTEASSTKQSKEWDAVIDQVCMFAAEIHHLGAYVSDAAAQELVNKIRSTLELADKPAIKP